MNKRFSFFSALGLLVFLLLPFHASQGIIIRHDKADSRYRVEAGDYPQLFFLHTSFDNKVCVATLIASRWAITAAHCTQQTPLGAAMTTDGSYPLTIAGQSYQVENLILHPEHDTGNELTNVDLALLYLDHNVDGITPAALYRNTDEANQVFSLLGWGFTGIGTRGLLSNDGSFRRAENRVEEAAQWLTFLFDDPRESGNTSLPLEGVPGLGDSGGPALLETEAGLVLAGIAVGELEEGEAPDHQGLYGTTQLYERVSRHIDWIEKTIGVVPE